MSMSKFEVEEFVEKLREITDVQRKRIPVVEVHPDDWNAFRLVRHPHHGRYVFQYRGTRGAIAVLAFERRDVRIVVSVKAEPGRPTYTVEEHPRHVKERHP